jgi:hypothetical protein
MATDASGSFGGAVFRAADGVEGWRVISDGACALFPTASFAR